MRSAFWRVTQLPPVLSRQSLQKSVAYLYNTRCLGIVFKRNIQGEEANVPKLFEKGRHTLTNESDPTNNFRVFADSDFAGDLETRRSTSGVVILLNGGPIAWSSQLGKAVATSTCEAEINAATQACKDAVHLHGILCDIGVRGSLTPSRSKKITLLLKHKSKAEFASFATRNTTV